MDKDQKIIYNNRYDRNIGVISKQEESILKAAKVCVVGCGGLGGYIIEFLGRMGIGNIVCVDGDVFDETNLNRQILATEKNIGFSKAKAAKLRMEEVNSEVTVTAVEEFFDEQNGKRILEGCTVVIDALDNISARFVLEDTAEKLDIPLVHGAIAGWNGQVVVVMPGDRLMKTIYTGATADVDFGDGNPPFTAAAIAAIEAAETVKLLLKRDSVLKKQLLIFDFLTYDQELIQL